MKIAFYFEASNKDGGFLKHQLTIAEILNNIKFSDIEFKFIASNTIAEKILKNKNFNTVLYKSNWIDKIFNVLYYSKFLIFILKKIKIQNKFETFLRKLDVDIIFFPGASRFSIFCDNINFVSYINEIHHLIRPDLPEYKNSGTSYDFNSREQTIDHCAKKSMNLIVDSNSSKREITKNYRCHEKKVHIIPYFSNLVEQSIKDLEIKNENLKEIINNKTPFYFYPAQFWPHKNHIYILNSLKILKDTFKKEFLFIFCGHRKQNFDFIKKKIIEMKLEKNILILDYVTDGEIIKLYQNCKALVMPTLIGHICLPVVEAFYFKVPIFYTKGLLDDEYKEYVNEIDIDDPNDLANALINIKDETIKEKINQAHKYFFENLAKDKLELLYKKLLVNLRNKLNFYK